PVRSVRSCRYRAPQRHSFRVPYRWRGSASGAGEWHVANSERKVSRLAVSRRSPLAMHFRPLPSHRPDFDHVRHKMLEQVLDAVLQRRGGRRAAGTGSLHVEIDDTVLEAAERDVAAVAGHSRTDPGFNQVLDGRNRLGVFFVEELI